MTGARAMPPSEFLERPVPDDVRALWDRWEGAGWRRMSHHARNELFPPDQRFSVRMPAGMCTTHRRFWIDYRDMHFNPVTGDRWPGVAGSPFTYVGHDMARLREERRVEWEEKSIGQMQLIENICLSGRSPQCSGKRIGQNPADSAAT